MCPKQQQNANWNQVEIEILIVRGRNLPRTNSTKCETQIIFAKNQENEHTPGSRGRRKLTHSDCVSLKINALDPYGVSGRYFSVTHSLLCVNYYVTIGFNMW